MSEFEKLEQEVKEQRLNEEELYKEKEEEIPQEVDETYLKDLQNMPLEQALYYLGLVGASFKKAPDPHAFASTYAASTTAMLNLIGFQSALAQTLKAALLDPKKRFIIGLVIIGGGLFLTPANAQSSVQLPFFQQQGQAEKEEGEKK